MERQRHKLLASLVCYVAKIARSTGYINEINRQRKTLKTACPSVLAGMRTLSRVRASDGRVRDQCRPVPDLLAWFSRHIFQTQSFSGKTPRLFSCPCSAEAAGTAGWRRRIACMYLVGFLACLHAISLKRRKNAQFNQRPHNSEAVRGGHRPPRSLFCQISE